MAVPPRQQAVIAGHAAVQDGDDHFHPRDVDAGQTRALNVAADGVDMTAKARFAQDNPEDGQQNSHQIDGIGN